MDRTRIVILGGGPAGLGAAYRLRCEDKAEVTVLERNGFLGGNAASFEVAGQPVDFGSHRLHPSCAPAILGDIQNLLGDDLQKRPRHGRISLRKKWIHFPLKPFDLMLRLDRRFAAGTALDMMTGPFRREGDDEASFASVLRAHLGPTICDHFYFPYARKIWGREPEKLSSVQARRRVSAGSFMKLLRKLFSSVPGVKPVGFSYFYYPRLGFGQISDRFGEAAADAGARILLDQTVERVTPGRSSGAAWTVEARDREGGVSVFEADLVWSTIPITVLSRVLEAPRPVEVTAAADEIEYRSMVLVYLALPVPSFSEYDAHYFPDEAVSLTRLSEPKNYREGGSRPDRTVLCAELPCDLGDEVWSRSPEDLGALVAGDLERSGIPLPAEPIGVEVRKLPQAYPIYRTGYEESFRRLDEWIDAHPGLLSYGRQGLFAHDNTHHALYMAYSAVDCLGEEGFDEARWQAYRREFEQHVVED